MKHTALAVAFLLLSSPAFAQFGNLGEITKRADQAKKAFDAVNISEKDERALGEAVSLKLIDRFGIYQDPAVTKYVTLVGTMLVQQSSRPNLDWKFIVVDSEGVNAYAAPGGLVHITKGALGLIKSESELAGVLAHELAHVTEKHTMKAIRKGKLVDVGTDAAGSQAGGLTGTVLNQMADASYGILFENKFDRDDENEADRVGAALAHKAGYSPTGLIEFLQHLKARNKDTKEPNGLFASHPQLEERVSNINKAIKTNRLTSTATVQPRYAKAIAFDAKAVTDVPTVDAGTRGVAGASSSTAKTDQKKEAEKKESAPKKSGSGFGSFAGALTGGKQNESKQTSASGAGRMIGPDNNATGGANKTPVRVTITAADIAEFKKGIA